jgi:stage II sporulation protein R
MNRQLKIWELSLLLALCFSLCTGLYARAQQNKLSDELIRLHVIANSDSHADQQIKLAVRDRMLELLPPLLKNVSDVSEARAIVENALPLLSYEARRTLLQYDRFYAARARLCDEAYPSRAYAGFALPAGNYISLQLVLGEGRGQNWWCVVFPPLCVGSVSEEAFSGLTEESAALIRSDDVKYLLKFRIIELYEEIRRFLS